jgi:3-oxoacyl-[acyl-carrier-protein] synthase III
LNVAGAFMKTIRPVGIAGTGHYLPSKILSNQDLEKIVDTSDEWIYTRTGMRQRRIAAPDEACSDLCIAAARQALAAAGMQPEELQLIIVATVTPDSPLPNCACIVQRELKAVNAGAFDVVNACSGFLTALMTGHGLVAAGTVDNVLVIGAEALSRILDYTERSTCILFGDGAGAFILKADHPRGRILDTFCGTDGTQWDAISMHAGGSRHPTSHATIDAKQHYLRMKGNETFKFAVTKFRDLIAESLQRNGYTAADVSLVVPHQVNVRIIESALKKLDIEMDRIYLNLDRVGNTSAASVPIAFDEALRGGRIKSGDLVSMVAFGAGLSWSSALVRW